MAYRLCNWPSLHIEQMTSAQILVSGRSGNDRKPDAPLTVNYVPSKFSTALVAPNTGPYRRKGRGDPLGLPKRGGGVEAFRSGEARIGNIYDDDYNDGYSKGKKKMKWTKFKWILLIANTLVRFSSFFFDP